ncbi:MAG: polyprenyl synthetase family protein [Desulfobacter sp.]|nr:MAG: polyprenyl synthetase family protein [Desulfobacter sp.]
MTDSTLSEFNLADYLKENRILVENSLQKILGRLDPERELVQAMAHSLMAGGKRVRPVLALAAAQALEENPMIALPACCAIEMIHTYSLIHDDLPAMDDDDLRRGLPTCHKKFSEATAILAGDGLLTHAFSILADPSPYFDTYPDSALRLALVDRISRAAGVNGMVEGQMLDMQAESMGPEDLGNKDQALDHLKKIHKHKTGMMIRASVEAGAVSAGADPEILKAFTDYAGYIGLSFQVMDDILNVEGDPEIMGKAAGSDALHDKMTFPAIIGLDNSKAFALELTDNAVSALDHAGFKASADPLRAIARYIVNRKR